MTTKTTRLNRYLFMITLSVLLGIARYFMYDDTDFSLFSLVDTFSREDFWPIEGICRRTTHTLKKGNVWLRRHL